MARGKSQDKRAAIMQAGAEMFLSAGFAAASMDSIAARAGVSKATLYSHFAGKAELFKSVVAARRETAMDGRLQTELPDDDPVAGLERIGELFMDLLFSPEVLSLYRLMMAEAHRQPELGRSFVEAGPAPTHRLVADYLARLDSLGRLNVPDPELVSELFLGMLRGKAHALAVLGLPEERPRRQIIAAAAQAVASMCAI